MQNNSIYADGVTRFDGAAVARATSCVVVLGSGRSGTSAVAQLLSQLGVAMERSLDAAGEQNPSGFAEDADIVRMNKALMENLSAGRQVLPDPGSSKSAVQPIEKALAAYIGRKVDAHDLWGFKDPRTALYLPIYRRTFNQLRIVPKYVLCLRNPAETVASLASHYGTEVDLAQLIWFSRNLAALRETGLNCFVLHYETLLEDPLGQARKLAAFVHEGGARPEVDEAAVLQVVRPNFNRSVVMPARITNPLVEKLYTGLRACEGVDFDRSALRDLVKELSNVEQAFLPWAHLAPESARSHEQKLKELEATCERLTQEHAHLADARRQVEALENDLAQERTRFAEEIAEARRRAEALTDASKEIARENARLAGEMVDTRLRAEEYQRRAVSAADKVEALEKQLAAAAQNRARDRKLTADRDRAIRQLRGRIEQLSDARESAAALARKRAAWAIRTEERRKSEVAALTVELEAAAVQAAARDGEIRQLRGRIKQLSDARDKAEALARKRAGWARRTEERRASDVKALTVKLEAAAAEVADMRASARWRIAERIAQAYRKPHMRDLGLPFQILRLLRTKRGSNKDAAPAQRRQATPRNMRSATIRSR